MVLRHNQIVGRVNDKFYSVQIAGCDEGKRAGGETGSWNEEKKSQS